MKITNEDIKDNTLVLRCWDEYIAFINKHKQELKGCIYRGQQDPDWRLTPSFFRFMPEHLNSEQLQNLAQNHHLPNFRTYTRGRHGMSYTDPNDNDENWWALGQHYGLATPLLDWVRSPYVAAFFGLIADCDTKSRAIFILDIEKIIKKSISGNGGTADDQKIRVVDPLTHENKRLVSQQGIFTYINDYRYRNIESYLSEFQGSCKEELFLLKITIPSSERQRVLEQLDLMNINQSTLFPDLSGSAEYSNYLLKERASSNNISST